MRRDKVKLLFLFFIFLSCSSDKGEVKAYLSYIKATCKGEVLYLEVADTPELQKKGLMFRKELPDSVGMLFVFNRMDFLSFWMKNTSIPLSIAFLDSNGVIVDIQEMEPYDETPHISKVKASMAIEVNRGWFSNHNITIGDTVKIPGYTIF